MTVSKGIKGHPRGCHSIGNRHKSVSIRTSSDRPSLFLQRNRSLCSLHFFPGREEGNRHRACQALFLHWGSVASPDPIQSSGHRWWPSSTRGGRCLAVCCTRRAAVPGCSPSPQAGRAAPGALLFLDCKPWHLSLGPGWGRAEAFVGFDHRILGWPLASRARWPQPSSLRPC